MLASNRLWKNRCEYLRLGPVPLHADARTEPLFLVFESKTSWAVCTKQSCWGVEPICAEYAGDIVGVTSH